MPCAGSPPFRRPLGRVALHLLALLLLAPASSRAAEVLRIGGTGAALGTFRALSAEFAKVHPGFRAEIPASLGSGGGVRALKDGQLDLALSARPLKGKERDEHIALLEYGRTPFVFAVAEASPIRSLRLDEVVAIYAGQLTRWPDGSRIRIVTRPQNDSNTVILRSLAPGMAKAMDKAFDRQGMILADTDQENATLIETLPGAFGACTLAQIRSERRKLRALALDGVSPSPETLADGQYPYGQSLYLVATEPAPPLAAAFVDFVFTSPDLLRALGYVPAPRR